MKENEFAVDLKKASPTKDELLLQDLSEDFVNDFLSTYDCVPKSTKGNISDNPLLNLIENYDVSKVSIGMINFNSTIEISNDYYFIGKVEIDHLVIDNKSGIVKVIDMHDENSVVWECAASGERFLEALIILAIFFTQRVLDDSLYEDIAQGEKIANEASEKAGGNIYLDFYRMLCS